MEKPMPGCMGRVVNLFDLGSNASGNKLLTEKAHDDRSQPSTDQPVAKKATVPVYSHTAEKLGTRDLKINIFNKKSSRTPMKMLIAQEMLKEPNSRKKPPSVVARLMGLDAFPPQNQILNFEGSLSTSYNQNKSTKFETGPRNRSNKDDFTQQVHSSHLFPQETQYCKDVYEVQPHSHKAITIKDRVLRKTKQKEDINERMALVRQKFMEAKRLSMDEELRHSKEFQDALDVLSSNREVFLKFLQVPNSLLSNYLYELQYVPITGKSKRITVLRPAKAAEMNEEKISKSNSSTETYEWDKKNSGWSGFNVHLKGHTTNQPTRIVVLKPSPGKATEMNSSSSPTSLRGSHQGAWDCNEGYRAVKTKDSREIGKDTKSPMRRKMSRSCGDDSFMSSALSNGYVGDQSSVNKSDTEDVVEDNLSDSEILTPNSKHSWDFIRKCDSPISSRSFSRASHSSESSVIREAKKRLSERWALMAMNGNFQEIRQSNKSASTLGDMLSLPEAKVPTQSDKEVKIDGKNICYSKSCGGEQEIELLSSGISNGENMDKSMDGFPGNLERSISAPVSSGAYEIAKPDVVPPCLELKTSNIKKNTKSKSAKLSIKGKVSSFFFPKNKKQNKDGQCSTSMLGSQDCLQLERISDANQVVISDKVDDIIPCAITRAGSEGILLKLSELNTKPPSTRHGSSACEGSISLEKTGAAEHLDDNREQPSPVSVLDALLDEEVSTPRSGGNAEMDQTSHLRLLKSCDATTKSPLIESVSRSLMWDEGNMETPSSISSGVCTLRNEVGQEQDWLAYVSSLFAAADLENETWNTVFHKWHSSESPLDPSLAEKCAVVDVDEQAKHKQKRFDRKLVFDSVNAALLEVVGITCEARECDLVSSKITRKSVRVIEEVWDLIKQWSFSESKISDGESDDGLIVENVVKRELVGKGWGDLARSEVEKAGREIEKYILQEIIEEALEELVW